ncbi:MAG: GNAT family N-acetyltransferase [Lactococcus sp.]|nr:GNAT family N-acetyltransferase [Lactococcus sp.]
MKIRRAQSADANSVVALYQSLVGTPGCPWHEDYPTLENAQSDISSSSLYLIEDETDKILAVASAVEETDLDTFEFWNKQVTNWRSLSRVAVCQAAQGRGLAQTLISAIIDALSERDSAGLRLLVSQDNLSALALYKKLGFKQVGQCFAYGADWDCYELILSI